MNKWIYILISIIIALISYISFVPTQVSIEKSIIINSPIENVYSRISNIESLTEAQWNPWIQNDNSNEFQFKGVPGLVGGKILFNLDQGEEGVLTLIELSNPSLVSAVIDLNKPSRFSINSHWTLSEAKEGTLVKWSLNSPSSYFNPIMTYSIQKLWSQFAMSYLHNLKNQFDQTSE